MKKHLLFSVCIVLATMQTMGQANNNLSNLTAPTAVNVPLLPKGDNARNLGSVGKSWKNLYVDGISYLRTAYTYYDVPTNQFRINNGGNRLVIGNNGNIGIGTLAPSTRLDVQTTGLTTVMQVKKPWTGSGTTNFNLVEINNAYTFGRGTGLFSSGGQIGVKGYAPNGGLTGYGVYGEAYGGAGSSYGVYGKSSSAGVAVGVYGYAVSSGSTAYGIYGYGNGTTSWAGYFAGRGYFSGNVGIGIAPTVKFQVNGGTDASPASGGYIVAGSTSSENIAIDNNEIMARNNGATSTLYLNHNGGDVVMCTSSGRVNIGTTTSAAGYILNVDGKAMVEELRVQLSGSWPDYVFDENYQLPSIHSLEASVKANKHLPGIASAEEVKKDGIIVGKMQTQMMEKIEELTLYIISLQKQIDELKNAQN